MDGEPAADCDNIDWNTDDDLEIENYGPSSSHIVTLSSTDGQRRASSTEDGEPAALDCDNIGSIVDGEPAASDCDNIDWHTDDDLEIESYRPSSSYTMTLPNTGGQTRASPREASSSSPGSCDPKLMDHFVTMGFSEEMVYRAIKENGDGEFDLILEALLRYSNAAAAGSSKSKCFDQFITMGFSEKMVDKAIKEIGEENTDLILETLVTYSALENSPEEQQQDSSNSCSDYERSFLEDFSDTDSWFGDEESTTPTNFEDNKLLFLVKMGYKTEEALLAVERCGPDSTVDELTDYLSAAQFSREADALLPAEEPRPFCFGNPLKDKKRKYIHDEICKKKKNTSGEWNEDDEPLHLPKPMIGFGVPNEPGQITYRKIPEAAVGPPYFYYENVALAPKGVWKEISRHLYEVEPEFVDSKYFCAAARKRGYIHNLPIHNRYPLLPQPPFTISEALPLTKKWWPSWDPRTKLNCLQTCIGSARLTDRIRKALEKCNGVPSSSVQKMVIYECRKWNLVWVGQNKVAPLEADEVEMLLGFPRDHTRGISRTDRYKSLGNSFQVDTVAYHLSVVKAMFPEGITLLSLFSGIGGAEVALHRLGVRLKTVVSVEISEVNRNIARSWWEQTGQKGNLVDIADVQHLTNERLEELMKRYGSFDLVVGGSPCNNLAGSNRHHRVGLIGEHSSLFYEYARILDFLKLAARNR